MIIVPPKPTEGRVLVVDDEEDTRSMISEVLSSRGYDVLAVASGFQALDALKSNSFDLVLLDVLMQGMDGFETLRRIRELDSITYLPVILVTALDASHRDFGIDLGADDYITKPYRIEDLLSRIRVGLRIKKLQDRLVEDKRRMAHIVENAFDAFFSLDADGLLSPLNARCSALFRDGVSADSRISFHSLLAPSEHDRLSTFIANALAGKKSASDFSLTDGRVIRIFSAPSAGEQILNCLARDVTEEARAAEELSSRARMLEDKVTVLNEGMRDSFRFESIISRNARMQAMFSLIRRISGSTATVLITGETGTGKELVAKAVHYNSPVSNGPFVKVDCGALSPGLLESELFGHIRGSFTGAIRDKAGRFEIARGGTIFLDEIANLPAEIQTRLLRVLQDGSFEPVGSNKTVSTDARVIAATNASLDREVASGRFRSDLYYRLNVVTIAVPPLRERRDDVPLLAEAFLREAAIVQGSRSLRLGSEAIKALSAYDWPGNVRELKHVIEEAALMADGPVLVPENLRVFRGSNADSGPVGLPLKDAMAEPEKEHIVRTLEKCEWNCSAAAHSLGVSRTTLYSKINKFEIVIPRKGRPSEKAGER